MRSVATPEPSGRGRRLFGRAVLLDCLAAVGSASVIFVGSASAHAPPSLFVRLLLAAAVSGPVTLRRRHPLPLLGLTLLLATAATAIVGNPMAWVFVPVAVVLYQVAATSQPRASLTAAAASLATVGAQALAWHLLGRGSGNAATACLLVGAAWGIGDAVRRKRAAAAHDREQATNTAVLDERLRIARELHDIVAHSMSVIAVQAAYGHYVIDTRPAEARTALGTIETTSRDVLAEMRHLVGALRPVGHTRDGQPHGGLADTEEARVGGAAPLGPAPGLGDLDQLVADTANAGVHITVQINGEPIDLPPGIDLSAYRIVQEAVTNVVRHGGTDRCRVTLDYRHDALTIEIINHGPADAHRSSTPARVDPPRTANVSEGHGLTGMRERVNLYSGQFTADPMTGGGFRVTARIPLGDQAS